MPTRLYQPSFTGGEIAPSLYARTDLGKYATALRTCLNFMVLAHGGAASRPGLEFIGEVKDSTKQARLIPFQFNTTQTYVLEFGDQTMRVIKDGGYVSGARTERVTNGGFATDLSGWTSVTSGGGTVAWSATNGGQAVFTPPAIGDAKLKQTLTTTQTIHTVSITCEIYIRLKIGTMDGGSDLVDFTSPSDGTHAMTFTAPQTTLYVQLEGAYPYSKAVQSLSVQDEALIVNGLVELTTPYADEDLARIGYTQSADTLYLTHPSYAPRKLTRSGHTTWALSEITFAPATTAPTGQSAAATGSGGTAATLNYKVTAINDNTGEESLPSSAATVTGWTDSSWPAGNYITVSWSAVTGCTQYRVYKEDNGIYGFIGVTESTSFTDDNIAADVSDTPPGSRNPFSGAGNYPATASFFEQRLYYGGPDNTPQTVYGSNINSYDNFNTSRPAGADEAITFTIASGQVHEVRHIVPLRDMILLTSGGEWRVSGAGDAALSPSSITIKPQSYRGSSRVKPLVIGDTILFIQDKGSVVRDLAYKLESDGFTGTDLSVLSNHLFEGHTITDWAYQQVPHSVVWCVRDDGVLLGFTYMREHEVWAWHRHTTDGLFESVAVVSEGNEDAAYFVVKRTIGGQSKRYVERLHSRAFTEVEDYFGVDSGLTYEGAAADTISGLDHLEGETVSILANGDVLTPQVVTGGAITLPREYTKVHVGLPYTCDLETLDVDGGQPTVQGKKKTVSKVTLRVLKSREFRAGPDSSSLKKTKVLVSTYGSPIAAQTGDVELVLSPKWNTNGRVFIRQDAPVPLTVLAIMPDVEVGG